MPAIITLVICSLCFLLILCIDVFRKRSLQGDTLEEYFKKPYDYELGAILIFKKLPRIFKKLPRLPILGQFGSLVLFFSVFIYIPALLAARIDNTWFLNGKAIGLFEDIMFLPIWPVVILCCYIFHKIMKFLPTAVKSIVKHTIDPKLSDEQTRKEKVKASVQEAASFIFQTSESRRILSRTFDIVLSILLLISVVWAQFGELSKGPGDIIDWADPPYFWGNTHSIISLFFLAYISRIFISYVIRISVAFRRLGGRLTDYDLLDIEPLHPDGAGGLGIVGDLTWRMALILAPPIIFTVPYYAYKGGDLPFWMVTIIGGILVPVVFFLPLWGVHDAMAKAKGQRIDILSKRFNIYSPIMQNWYSGAEGTTKAQGIEARGEIEHIYAQYERVSKMPIWPFNINMLLKVSSILSMIIIHVIAGSIITC